jgi:hypothetical protein
MNCKATIKFGDDFGDNSCTFYCQLPHGHDGRHQESGDMGFDGMYSLPYLLQWQGSDPDYQKAVQAHWTEMEMIQKGAPVPV